MKITDKIISIPPYISTTWDKVVSLHRQGHSLIITLSDSVAIEIPALPTEIIEEIFHAHANFLEHTSTRSSREVIQPTQSEATGMGLPFRLLFSTLESLGQALQHNPNYSNLPPIPQDIAGKLEMLAKAIPPEEFKNLPDSEPGCNCIFCQMVRILRKEDDSSQAALDEPQEEEVRTEELQFDEWNVRDLGDKVFLVTNKLDPTEQYNVYLGDPIGCTCGKDRCEHIVAVLRH